MIAIVLSGDRLWAAALSLGLEVPNDLSSVVDGAPGVVMQASEDPAGGPMVAVGVQQVYDAVAQAYDGQFGDELSAKPLDRALLSGFVELVGRGRIADVGCGPGHVSRFLATQHPDAIGIDLSPVMIGIARERSPELEFTVASMLALPASDGQWAGVVALYSIIHLDGDERGRACREFARVIHPGGWLLVAFHLDSHEFAAGQVNHLTSWFGQRVELDGYFLDPGSVVAQLEAADFTLVAKVERLPDAELEYPSRRCYLLAQRR